MFKAVWDWLNYRYIYKWNRIGEFWYSHIYDLLFWQSWKGNSVGKEVLLNQWCWNNWMSVCWKKKEPFLDPYFISYININYFYLFIFVCIHFLLMHSMAILNVKQYFVLVKLMGVGFGLNRVKITIFTWTLCNVASILIS